MSAPLPAFDIRGALPRGVTVLEASAGTGKTYAVTGLAARYVIEGTPLERILLVTFTIMASGELRERVRERLLGVEQALRRPAGPREEPDPVVALVRAAGPPAVAVAVERLSRALANFDAGTMATTHSFCQEALDGLGVASDLEPGLRFAEDLSDLRDEVLDDLYLRAFHRESNPEISRAQAQAIARAAVTHADATIAPAPAGDELAQRRVRLAASVRRELERRKRRLAVMTYDDLLERLNGALAGPGGEVVVSRLAERYEIVLVDEFQDTDPVQWEIMRRAFGHRARALVLIADPKQAIYAFRGADVYAYLRAFATAAQRCTLGVNHRSDPPLLRAYDALFANARLGHPDIVYRTVVAARTAAPRRHGAPLRLRIAPRELIPGGSFGQASAPRAREWIAADLARDIVSLLESDAEVAVGAGDPDACRPVCPGDVAALVRTNYQASLVERVLLDAGVPAVMTGAGSVFATGAAEHWLALLEALERPASVDRAHRAALTPFLGWTAAEVATAGDATWEGVHERLHAWARILREQGVASLLETVTRSQELARRVLAQRDGERVLTDLRHVGQLLHATASREGLGTTALGGWLRRRIAQAGRDSGDDERTRRLESDAQAVQVLTIHRSKGLEFPIVYLPFLWDAGRSPDGPEPVAYHDPEHDDRRMLDVCLRGRAFGEHQRQATAEQRGEELRLAYVALTRARHQAVVWWAGTRYSKQAPLSRLIFDRQADGMVPADGSPTRSDGSAREVLETLAAGSQGTIAVETAPPLHPARWTPTRGRAPELAAAAFARTLDRRWRRTSYSAMTAAAHELTVASEPEEPLLQDEPDRATAAGGPSGSRPGEGGRGEPAWLPSPLLDLPVGVAAGTLVHQALEASDFAASDLTGELLGALRGAPGRRAVTMADPAAVAAGLAAALSTPLGPLAAGRRLCDLGRRDRVDELSFELPLAGGDRPLDAEAVTPGRLAGVLQERLASSDPMRGYAARLGDPALSASVRGYLTGSLDLVARVPGERYLVIDYKTNWLAEPAAPLTTWHYRPPALVAEMYERHYGLQALLYLVALHRYLRWRVPGYDPDRHLAGVIYLFLRGMAGPDTPVLDGAPCGVFAWAPPPGVVGALSDVLDGRPAR